MLPRERMLAALGHRQPDRVPTGENAADHTLAQEILGRPTLCNSRWNEREALWAGRRHDVVADSISTIVDLALTLEWDYVRAPAAPADRPYPRPQMTGPYSWLDERGREVHYHPDSGNIATLGHREGVTIDDLPDPDAPVTIDPSELDIVRGVVERLGDTHFIIGRSPADGTFPWGASGSMEDFLVRMLTEPAFVERAIAAETNRAIAWCEALLDAGCDAVMTCDDFSDNRGPIVGPDLFRRYMLPALRRQADAIHARGGLFVKHTDGNVWPILGDMIEAGIDGWHGIQPSIGMDLRLLKERHGADLCFFGGVNCETLVAGTPEEAHAEARYAIEHAAAGGGLVLTCGNVLQPGTRLENYLAGRDAVRQYGAYRQETS